MTLIQKCVLVSTVLMVFGSAVIPVVCIKLGM